MTVLHTPADSGPNPAVRLIGIGASGRRFVQLLHSHIDGSEHTPLADLPSQQPNYIEACTGKTTDAVDRKDLEDTRILCLAYGFDVTPTEIEAAMLLIWRIWGQDAYVIGIVLGAHLNPKPSVDSMLGILCDSIDARIDVAEPIDTSELVPLQWFYIALQRSVLEGLSILGAAWDHSDVVETLGFGPVQLELFTQPVDKPAHLDAAMVEVLEETQRRGIWLEEVLGAVIVLWVPSEYRLTVQVVRNLGRTLGDALGAGALHLTIRLRGRPAAADLTGHLTLVVSLPLPRAPK